MKQALFLTYLTSLGISASALATETTIAHCHSRTYFGMCVADLTITKDDAGKLTYRFFQDDGDGYCANVPGHYLKTGELEPTEHGYLGSGVVIESIAENGTLKKVTFQELQNKIEDNFYEHQCRN